jgi:hypothetical protein
VSHRHSQALNPFLGIRGILTGKDDSRCQCALDEMCWNYTCFTHFLLSNQSVKTLRYMICSDLDLDPDLVGDRIHITLPDPDPTCLT